MLILNQINFCENQKTNEIDVGKQMGNKNC